MSGVPRQDLTGRRFGKLVVVAHYRDNLWKCVCDCGNTKYPSRTVLINGSTASCGGCVRRVSRTNEEKFWGKVKILGGEECWEWLGHRNEHGYGFARYGSKQHRTHRIAYMLHNKCTFESMEGFGVLHSCDNPSCCNPSHLRLGTQQDNVDDMLTRKRHTNKPIAIDTPHLTVFGRNLIHWRREKRVSQTELAGRIGTAKSMICYYERRARSLTPQTVESLCKALGVTENDLLVDRDGVSNPEAIFKEQSERLGLIAPELSGRCNSILSRIGINTKEGARRILPENLGILGNLDNCGNNSISELWKWAGLENAPSRDECRAVRLLESKGYIVIKGR